MEECEWNVYDSMTRVLSNLVIVNGHIWLSTSPSECVERIARRDRAQDMTLSLDWLTRVHERHVDLFALESKKKPCLVLNGFESMQEALEMILCFCDSLVWIPTK